jgi:hypothetical protein
LLLFHHIGSIVEDIDVAISSYKLLLGNAKISKKLFISSQNVYVCFVEIGNSSFIELVQPIDESSVVHKMRKKGITYYHLAYLTDEYDVIKNKYLDNNFKILNEFRSEAFDNKRCMFMYAPDGHLIELIEHQ